MLTTEMRWQLCGEQHLLDHVLVDATGLHQVTHAHGYKKVPRHRCDQEKISHLRCCKYLNHRYVIYKNVMRYKLWKRRGKVK